VSQSYPPGTGSGAGGAPGAAGAGGEGEDLVGATLANRYRIEAELGRGGMGAVYRAVDQNLNSPVVVKVPHPHMLRDETFRLRFNQEVQSLTRSPHPAVVRIQDYGDHQGQPFFVVEYKGGGDLDHRIESAGTLTPDEVLEWLPAVAAALDSIHARGTLHRDIKPANILFDAEGNPCLADFGIATVMGAASSEAETVAPSPALTAENRFIGSPAYAPPEALARLFTPAYDQYSLGVVVYEALTGRRPHEADTPEKVIALKMQEPTPLSAHRRLGTALEQAVMRALARQPEDRYPNCQAFVEAFRAAAQEVPAGGGGRGAALGAGVVMALLAVGGAGWWLSTRPQPDGGQAGGVTGTDATGTGAELGGADPAPTAVSYRLGSTEAEFHLAMDLCEAELGRDQCDGDDYVTELPRSVDLVLPRFDRHPATVADFADFVAATGHETVAEAQGSSYDGPLRVRDLSWRSIEGDERPVTHLAQADAAAYCEHEGARLPTAEEWEAAARGTDARIFPWGSEWDPARVDWDPDAGHARPVGSFPSGATPDGLQDMSGGVWEWTADTRQTSDGAMGVLKGGSWRARSPADLRAAVETEAPPGDPDAEMGVRCVR